MEENRPDPDRLLRQLGEAERKKGRLKIFFGFAAGVGKTYAMLQAAQAAKKSGVDVVVGYVEPHVRPETLALTQGLEILPPLEISHKGITLREFDLDGAIARAPELVLVDEFAHTNAGECRHVKRYQDVQELLHVGIDVYTTVNVQHIESINDIVASITGVVVRERIPDRVFDSASQVELVDIEPDDLIARLNEGKVYRGPQAQRALGNFFIRDNLVALREIALRRTADHVNKTSEKQMSEKKNYYTEEHLLICLSSSPSNAKVIRTAARMADAFHGTFTALFVETPNTKELSDGNRARLRENLKLAEQLGAKIATVYGDDVPYQISEYAKASGVSKIIIGRSNNKRSSLLPRPSLVESLTRLAPNMDIHIIPDNQPPYAAKPRRPVVGFKLSAADTMKTLAILCLSTLMGTLFSFWGLSEANIITVFILGVLFTALLTEGKLYGMVSSLFSVLVFNYLFTYPYLTLRAEGAGYPITFLVMFIASFVTSTLTMRVKSQARQMSYKAYRTEVLLETSQKLQQASTREAICGQMAGQMLKLLGRTILLYPVAEGKLEEPAVFPDADGADTSAYTAPSERAVAQWVCENNKHAGATTNTLPGAKCLYLAVRSHDTVFAVVAIAMGGGEELDSVEKNMLIAMLSSGALALEKEYLNEASMRITVQARQEELRANLLRAISHDLRTPLTSISGNAGVLMANSGVLDEQKKTELYTYIYDDSMWLINLVENLLSVTRIENGTMSIHMEPELLDEVIQEALRHINRRGSEYQISVHLEDDLLMAKMDSRLVIQVMINIVDNAIKYTPPGSAIVLTAKRAGSMVEIEIADDGSGIPDEAKERLFDMFYTADNLRGDARRGLGLGLSLCKSIVTSHGGAISVRDNFPHGTVFCFTLQAEEVRHE